MSDLVDMVHARLEAETPTAPRQTTVTYYIEYQGTVHELHASSGTARLELMESSLGIDINSDPWAATCYNKKAGEWDMCGTDEAAKQRLHDHVLSAL